MTNHDFAFSGMGISEGSGSENQAINESDINNISKLCSPGGKEINQKEDIQKKTTEIQTNKTHLAKGISIIRQYEADFMENPQEKFVISNALSIESYKSGNFYQVGISFETERNISETYCESEEVPENERVPETESTGSQTSTSFTAKAKKLHVKVVAPEKEISIPEQHEKRQKVDMIQTMSDLGNTLDDLHKSLDIVHNHLENPKVQSFGTQTTLGAVEYIVASEIGEEDEDEPPNLYIPGPYFNAVLAQ
ncbi:hypothetical protein M9Y10_028055 [Tritrichomonas musculus]|uniref:Uncharacterized protein n=1 Tax=Tritrichomonas musculus TaxID=1915356 RepID=A0ABR2KJA6_9EUKA